MTREEAIKVLNMVEAHGLADKAKRVAIEALSERTGEWEIDAEKMEIRCPKCGEKFRFDDADEMLDYLEYANYCIFCGEKLSAMRMRGKNNEA